MTLPIKPVTDRTKVDVSYAAEHRGDQVPNKGALDPVMLNRIETNCQYVADQLNHYGYYVRTECKTDWTEWDWPTQGQIDRIRGNISAMIASFCKLQGSPGIRYWDSLDWQDANSLEQNLANLDEAIRLMVDGFRRSGTFAAGQDFAL